MNQRITIKYIHRSQTLSVSVFVCLSVSVYLCPSASLSLCLCRFLCLFLTLCLSFCLSVRLCVSLEYHTHLSVERIGFGWRGFLAVFEHDGNLGAYILCDVLFPEIKTRRRLHIQETERQEPDG